MTDVKRYKSPPIGLKESGQGMWVRYEDYAALQARVAELEAKLAKAIWRLEQMRDDHTGYRHSAHFRRGASVTLADLKEGRG